MNARRLKPADRSAKAGLRFAGRRKQTGISLLELMVGLTIGLLVTTAAVGTLFFNRISSNVINDTILLQQDASTLMRIIGRQLKQAGAVPAVQYFSGTEQTQLFIFRNDYTGVVAGAPVPASVTGVNGTRDTLTVGYSVDANIAATMSDCLGTTTTPATVELRSTFSVTAAGTMNCTTFTNNTQPILNNVEDLQVWYAVRDAAANVRYFPANNVTNWALVEAVQVCVRLVGTSTNNNTGAAPTVGCSGENIAADGRIRRVFRQVFTLRNAQALG